MNVTFIEGVTPAWWQKTMNLAFKTFVRDVTNVEVYRKFYIGHFHNKVLRYSI